MRNLIVIGTVCGLALGASACGGSSSPSASSSSQSTSSAPAPTLKYTSDAWAAIYAQVNSQREADTACTTQQSQLRQQVRQIEAKLSGSDVGGNAGVAGRTQGSTGQAAVLVAFVYGSPAFPEQHLSDLLIGWTQETLSSVYVNVSADKNSYGAPVVICVVTVG